MKVRIYIDRNQYTVEVRYKDERLIRYTMIPDTFSGGEISVISESEEEFVYKISPLFERLNTENGYILNYNIKLTNWLNFFVYKTIGAVVRDSELEIKKNPSVFSRELKEFTSIKLV